MSSLDADNRVDRRLKHWVHYRDREGEIMRRVFFAAVAALAALAPLSAYAFVMQKAVSHTGTRFYFSAAGSDSNPGTLASPWQTCGALYTHGPFRPGDRFLFRGGATLSGCLIYLDSSSASTNAANPITLGSYGTGSATINAGTGYGIYFYNLGNVKIDGLVIASSGISTNAGTGIMFGNSQAASTLGNLVLTKIGR